MVGGSHAVVLTMDGIGSAIGALGFIVLFRFIVSINRSQRDIRAERSTAAKYSNQADE